MTSFIPDHQRIVGYITAISPKDGRSQPAIPSGMFKKSPVPVIVGRVLEDKESGKQTTVMDIVSEMSEPSFLVVRKAIRPKSPPRGPPPEEPEPKRRKLSQESEQSDSESESDPEFEEDEDSESSSSESESDKEENKAARKAGDVLQRIVKKKIDDVRELASRTLYSAEFIGRIGKRIGDYDSENDVKVARNFIRGLVAFITRRANKTESTNDEEFNDFVRNIIESVGDDEGWDEIEKDIRARPDSDWKMAFFLARDVISTLYGKKSKYYLSRLVVCNEESRENVHELFAGIVDAYNVDKAKPVNCMMKIQAMFRVFLGKEKSNQKFLEDIEFMNNIFS